MAQESMPVCNLVEIPGFVCQMGQTPWADGPLLDAAIARSLVASIFLGILAVHWFFALSSKSSNFHRKTQQISTQISEEQTDKLGVQELDNILARSWFTACRSYFAHAQLGPICCEMCKAWQSFDLAPAMWLVGLCSGYVVYLAAVNEAVPATPKMARLTCGMIHASVFFGFLGAVLSDKADTDDFVAQREMIARGQLILAVAFPDRDFLLVMSGFWFAANVGTTVWTCGFDALTVWFWTNQAFHLSITCLAIPITTLNIHRDRMEAFIQAEDSGALVSAFQCMLKGLCDGNVILDGSTHICGASNCLPRLLRTQEDLSGRKFSDFITEEKGYGYTRLEDFLAESTADGINDYATPRCLRVKMKGDRGIQIPMDVFHVVLPKRLSRLGDSTDRHLLALIEDADARLKAEDPNSPSCRNRLTGTGSFAKSRDSPGSECGSSSCDGDAVEVLEELSQIKFLLDCSTDLFDISEAHLHFARMTTQPTLKLGMPTLKKFVRPSDWPALKTNLCQYASAASGGRCPAPQALPPVMIQVPGECHKYLCARQVSVRPLYSGFRPPGGPTYLHVTLNNFHNTPRQMQARFMGDVHEDPSEELSESQESWDEHDRRLYRLLTNGVPTS